MSSKRWGLPIVYWGYIGLRFQRLGFRVWGSELWVSGLGFGALVSELRVEGLGFWI